MIHILGREVHACIARERFSITREKSVKIFLSKTHSRFNNRSQSVYSGRSEEIHRENGQLTILGGAQANRRSRLGFQGGWIAHLDGGRRKQGSFAHFRFQRHLASERQSHGRSESEILDVKTVVKKILVDRLSIGRG